MDLLTILKKKVNDTWGFYFLDRYLNKNIDDIMIDKNIEKLIIKFISKSITEQELDKLCDYLESPENEKLFKRYVHLNYALDFNLMDFEIEKTKLILRVQMDGKSFKSGYRSTRIFYKYASAAAVLVLLGFAFFFLYHNSWDNHKSNTLSESAIVPGTDKAVLTLENGNQVVLEKGSQFSARGVESDGESLLYNNSETPHETEISYNYLTVPRGGQFYIQLSDGTRIWLNSESKLKFPVGFNPNATREVELVYGEAYFDVTPHTENNNTPFKVRTQVQNVEVLGTEFNISAYQGSENISTTLVEGKVLVSNGVFDETLIPGIQSLVNIKEDNIELKKVNLAHVTGWKDGYFRFNEKPLDDMMEILGRWYDVKIEFRDSNKEHLRFSGVLRRTEDITNLLNKIERTRMVEFEISKGKIIVK